MRLKINKKVLLILSSALIVITSLIFMLSNVNKNESIVLYVNEEPVYEDELLNSVKYLSSYVRNEIMVNHEIEADEFSWDKEILENQTPKDILKNKAIEKTKYEKILQIKAKENDLIKDIDYKSIKDDLDKENKKRMEDKNNNKIVYGTTKFDFSEYYQYMNNNLSIQLKKVLTDNETLKISDKELKSVYENNKQMFQSENDETGKLELLPFEMVKSSVKDLGLNEKFNQYMNMEVKKASIKLENEGRIDELLDNALS